jgi:hypothetical protein
VHTAPVRAPPIRISEWRPIIAALLASRLGLVAAGMLGLAVMPPSERRLALLPDAPWLSSFAQWDAEHYVRIALDGYVFEVDDFSNIPFFPLYPWLMRVGATAIGRVDEAGAALAGLLISNVALVVALVYLAALVSRDISPEAAGRSLLYLLVLPTTLFLSAVYAESLFLATSAATLYHARSGEWYRAGVAGALAALTRPFGFLLLVPLAIEMLRQRPAPRAAPALALVPLGLGAYFLYLWWRFGDPYIYFRASEVWGRELEAPWDTLLGYLRGPLSLFDWPYSVVDLTSVLVLTVLAVLAWRMLPLSYAAYASVGLVFSLSSGIAWFSAARHGLALFPLLIVVAMLGRWKAFHWAWLLLSGVLAAAFMARFAAGYWVN